MAKPTAEQYYEAFKQSYLRLQDALPIDVLAWKGDCSRIFKRKLAPVHSGKVVCLLDEIECRLRVGIIDQFESFICVMEEFATNGNDIVVKRWPKTSGQ